MVTLAGAPMPIVSVSDTTIVVKLNSWSSTGAFYVSRRGGWTTTSASSFTLAR